MRTTARLGANTLRRGVRFYMSLNDWLCKDRKIFAMTLFEILNFNRELLERLAGTGYKPDDYKYIDLYKEYEQMRRKGEKVTYCVAFLSARHGVSERKVYEILGRFKRNVRSMQYEKNGILLSWGEEMNFASET